MLSAETDRGKLTSGLSWEKVEVDVEKLVLNKGALKQLQVPLVGVEPVKIVFDSVVSLLRDMIELSDVGERVERFTQIHEFHSLIVFSLSHKVSKDGVDVLELGDQWRHEPQKESQIYTLSFRNTTDGRSRNSKKRVYHCSTGTIYNPKNRARRKEKGDELVNQLRNLWEREQTMIFR